MGSGKSSAAITYMNENPDKKFIYITPYLEEARRIMSACNNIQLLEPKRDSEHNGSKTLYAKDMIDRGESIASTHQAFRLYTDDMLDMIRDQNYTLIMDETVEIIEQVDMNCGDIEVLIEGGHLELGEDGYYRRTDKDYKGEHFKALLRSAHTRDMFISKNSVRGDYRFYCWKLPPSFVKAFNDVIVLTYLFEGQPLCWFFRMHGIQYEKIGVSFDGDTYRFCDRIDYIPEYVLNLPEMIDVCDNRRMNAIGNSRYALSATWYSRKSSEIEQLKKNLTNYFRNINRGIGKDKRMWATYGANESKIKGDGYSKGHVSFNERATNNYKNKTVLAYCVNVFLHIGHKMFYRDHNVEIDEEMYALSTMIQWIWRSAIRDGKQIHIYVPSRRMRTLLTDWIDRTSNDARQRKEGIELGCCGTTEETTELL